MNYNLNTILQGGIGAVTFFGAWLFLMLSWATTGQWFLF